MNPKSPDYEHKVTMKALWVDGRSTPAWVRAMLKLLTLSELPSRGGYHSNDFQEIVRPNRYCQEHELSRFVRINWCNCLGVDEAYALKLDVKPIVCNLFCWV